MDESVVFLDTSLFKKKLEINTPGPIQCIAISPNGKLLATSSLRDRLGIKRPRSAIIKIWSIPNGRLIDEFQFHHENKHIKETAVLCFSPDNQHLAIGSADFTGAYGLLSIWDLQKKQFYWQIQINRNITVNSLSYHPTRDELLTTAYAPGQGNDMTIWNWRKKTTVLQLQDHTHQLFSASYSPNGKLIVSTGVGVLTSPNKPQLTSELFLWSSETGKRIGKLDGINANFATITTSFSMDSKYLVSGDLVGNTILWNVEGRKKITAWRCYAHRVYETILSSNGQLATLGSDHSTPILRIWDIKSLIDR